MISATLQGFVKCVNALDSSTCCNDMVHFPILMTLKFDVYTKNCVEEGQLEICKISMKKISNYDEYANTMNHIIRYSTDIYDLPSLQYFDRNCQDHTHRLEIDQVCILLTDICIFVAALALPKVAKRNAIPGCNVAILPLKRTAEFLG